MHIPKTGGTTLNSVLRKNYGEQMIQVRNHWPDNFSGVRKKRNTFEVINDKSQNSYVQDSELKKMIEEEKPEAVSGHVYYRFTKNILKDYDCITIIRDPLKRIISEYKHARSSNHYLYNEVKNMSIKQYVESGISLSTDNCQVRFISGNYDSVPFGGINKKHLKEAAKNIKNVRVGLTTEFNSFLAKISSEYKWPFRTCLYKVKRKTASQIKINEEDVTSIVKYNKFDISLYRYMKKELSHKYGILKLANKIINSI